MIKFWGITGISDTLYALGYIVYAFEVVAVLPALALGRIWLLFDVEPLARLYIRLLVSGLFILKFK